MDNSPDVTRQQGSTGAKRQKRLVVVLASIVAVMAIIYLGISAVMADKLSRPDRKSLTSTPSADRLSYESVQFPSAIDGILLKGWFIDSPGTKTILMMHGRNGIRDDTNIGVMDVANGLAQAGYDVLTFDFRAHGESGGTRYSLGQWEVQDVAGALEYLKSRAITSVGALGYSMGASTEILAAADHPEMRVLVADAPFADLSALLDVQLPKASGLPGFFNPGVIFMVRSLYGIDVTSVKPIQAIPRLNNRPMLLIHGTADETIPVDHAYMFEKAGAGNPNFETWIVPGAAHVESFKDHPQEYLKRVIGFFDRYLK
ncbi:MAG: alpha/beta fold hydrolase [Dehalococcoidia bacterium]|nr:alpha/beta fold hydrolase [Dehalococcoidia bacterium]